MGYALQNRMEVTLLINNSEFPLDSINFLYFLHIGYSTRMKLPTVHFAVADARHALDVIGLQDGTPITVSIRAFNSDTKIFNFRKFNHKKFFNGECFVYEVDGYLNSPLYWAGTAVGGIRGTSSEVLSQVANTCGLVYDGITTSDSQLWMPRNQTYGEFVKATSSRGYLTDNSYMVSGVDASGTLKYRDVNNLPGPSATIVLGQMVPGQYIAAEYKPVTSSGLNNKMQGYQNTRFDQSIVGPDASTAHSQITFTPDVTQPLFNANIAQQIGSGYRSFGGLDMGNSHASYEKAYYQNQRYAAMYSMAVEFTMITPTDLTLFDKFTFSVDTESHKTDSAYAGVYTVASKALYIQGAAYGEKILGVRNGVNT